MQLDLEETRWFPAGQRTRLWHFFANFEDAEACVLGNKGDIFESYYNVALIEEHYVIDPIDPPPPEFDWLVAKQWWYKVDYPESYDPAEQLFIKPVVSKMDQAPQMLRNVVLSIRTTAFLLRRELINYLLAKI